MWARTDNTKRVQNLKGALLIALAGVSGRQGKSTRGLLDQAIESIKTLYNTGDPELVNQAIDKTLKLLPYALPKEGYNQPLLTTSQGNNGTILIQLNQYVDSRNNRVNSLESDKAIEGDRDSKGDRVTKGDTPIKINQDSPNSISDKELD